MGWSLVKTVELLMYPDSFYLVRLDCEQLVLIALCVFLIIKLFEAELILVDALAVVLDVY